MTKRDLSKFNVETRLGIAGRDPARFDGAVNAPIHRATTVIAGDADKLYGGGHKTYALEGMAVQEGLREALLAVEGGADCILAPSGLAACTLALLSAAKSGGDLLVSDSIYGPTRRFCDTMLKRFGVTTRYFDPRIAAGVADLINDDTCAIFLESPGSLTLEVQDIPAIAKAAHARGVTTILDNTWSAGLFFKPFDHGVDISVQALTKYQAGHADAFMGSVICATTALAERVRMAYKQLGLNASPDDAYLVLRGMRSMAVRLERQSASALKIANWLETRPEVARVLHPALPSSPDHALWKRDFTGSSGVLSFVLKPTGAVDAMLKRFALFGLGFSWGGYESLVVHCDPQIVRTAVPWKAEGPTIRLSVGLEHVDDLIADLDDAFTALR